METIELILSIVWGILCLILFFKIWGMCNNISRINKKINKNDDIETTIQFLLHIGEKEKAKEVLFNRILTNDTIFDNRSALTPEEKIEKILQLYEDEFKTLGISVPKTNSNKE